MSALKEVTNKDWKWQYPAYAKEKRWPNMSPPGTVAWHVAHLIHSARHYTSIVSERPVRTEPETPPPDFSDYEELLVEMHKAHDEFIQTVSRLSDSASFRELCSWNVAQ